MPLLSVIIACLNDLEHLPRAVNSVLSQSHHDIELVIMDGASHDGTPDYLRTLTGPRVQWRSERDGGLTQAWNKGIALARGDWFLFLGADDYIWDTEVVARAAPYLAGTQALIAFGEVQIVAESEDRVVQTVRFDKPALLAQLRSPRGLGVPHQGFFHSRRAFATGDFDASFQLAADYEFISRFKADTDFLFLPVGPVTAFRMGGLSTDPWVSVQAYREFSRVHRMRGRGPLHGSWQLAKAHAKLAIKRIIGAGPARHLVNFSRALRGLPLY
jgi:glycosyltransferase involved in cell wall biosynthesis